MKGIRFYSQSKLPAGSKLNQPPLQMMMANQTDRHS